MPMYRIQIGSKDYILEAEGVVHAMQMATVHHVVERLVAMLPTDLHVDEWDELRPQNFESSRDPHPPSSIW